MKIYIRRPSLDYTPKQWVGLCNTFLLLLVAFMCGMVIYGVHNLSQKSFTILDSSVVAIDFITPNHINSKPIPEWRNITEDISIYSAFHKTLDEDEGIVLIIGSSTNNDLSLGDLHCLFKYGEEEDISLAEVTYQKFSDCSTVFLYCPTKGNRIPTKVILISYTDTILKNWIEIEPVPTKANGDFTKPAIATCIQPINTDVSVKQIKEFVSFYEAIGLKHFYFYNYNITEDSINFINQLVSKGHSINLLPWNKRIERSDNCHASWSEYVQDCLHRAMNKYSDALTVEITDFFVPTKYVSVADILDNYSKSYEELQIEKANYCDVHKQNLTYPSIWNMVFRGPIHPSNTNYFLRLELTAAIEFYGSFPSKNAKMYIETLPKYKAIVQHLGKKCDSNVVFDALASKYLKMMDKSIALETNKQTPRKYFEKGTSSLI